MAAKEAAAAAKLSAAEPGGIVRFQGVIQYFIYI